ncbi:MULTISPECIES: DUF3703 domain-containing protein [Sphingopyxis]|jgi:hypothetical protein|uniref:DUF3703 domain-containing protein n=1 Tax=Sphingopyxis macrogoltabida TaxID=33050 RepID=A0A0N9U8E0_SPHMC|nr:MULTISPECIES: DUF3703 domain-containing protein [Sphingopyxis]ALH79237.1 hypothetical protein AN936_02270 [Sphingopyxis macrogoltabida]
MSDGRPATQPKADATGAGVGVRKAIATELALYRRAREACDIGAAWHHLERAHILSQPLMWFHLSSHVEMLKFAISRGDIRETFGQLFRIGLVPFGALMGRLPIGNTGRARVSAFAPMPVPEDLQRYMQADAP